MPAKIFSDVKSRMILIFDIFGYISTLLNERCAGNLTRGIFSALMDALKKGGDPISSESKIGASGKAC
jgi:hypothetical protein